MLAPSKANVLSGLNVHDNLGVLGNTFALVSVNSATQHSISS